MYAERMKVAGFKYKEILLKIKLKEVANVF